MRLQPQQPEQLQQPTIPKIDHQFSQKLNQSLLPQTNFILFLIVVVSMLVNATRGYGYNVAIGCGIYFLSTKNPYLTRFLYFYMLVTLTIVADGISIALLHNKVSVFHWAIAPIIEIILKILLLAFQGLQWFRESKLEKQRLKVHDEQQSKLRKQIEAKKTFQMEQRKYLAQKKDRKVNPSSYYEPSKYQSSQQNYKNEAYTAFNQLQFEEEQEGRRR